MASRLRGFDQRSVALIREAEGYGWEGRVSSKGHWIGRSPDGTTTMSVPKKADSGNRTLQNCRADFLRWQRQAAINTAAELSPDLAVRTEQIIQVDDALQSMDPSDPLYDVVARGLEKKAAENLRRVDEVIVAHALAEVEAEMEQEMETREPWLASRGSTVYPSKAVVEVKQGDTVLRYECSQCEWSSDVPQTVAAHYRRAHAFRKGRTPQEPSVARNPNYQPTERLIVALEDWLAEHGEDWETPRDLAVLMLQWQHARPDLPMPTPAEPLTADQMIDRIRRIIDNGAQYEALMGLEQENAALRQQAEEQEQKVAALTSTLEAFADLAASLKQA